MRECYGAPIVGACIIATSGIFQRGRIEAMSDELYKVTYQPGEITWFGHDDGGLTVYLPADYRNINEQMLAALEEIRRDCGHVCELFEICTHRACSSSHAAWEIADAALKGETR